MKDLQKNFVIIYLGMITTLLANFYVVLIMLIAHVTPVMEKGTWQLRVCWDNVFVCVCTLLSPARGVRM